MTDQFDALAAYAGARGLSPDYVREALAAKGVAPERVELELVDGRTSSSDVDRLLARP